MSEQHKHAELNSIMEKAQKHLLTKRENELYSFIMCMDGFLPFPTPALPFQSLKKAICIKNAQ